MARKIDLNNPNLPIVGQDGAIEIILSRDRLWADEPCPPGYDTLQSTLEFMTCAHEEVTRRYPHSAITCTVRPGDDPVGVYIINHSDPHAFRTVARLLDDLERHRRHEWLVQEGHTARGLWRKAVDEEGNPVA